MSRAIIGVEHRDSRAFGKYCWYAWEGVTLRACFNWSLVRRVIGGCVFCVWDLVRRAMG